MKKFHEMTWQERLEDAKKRHTSSQYRTSLFVNEQLLKQIHIIEIQTALTFGQTVPDAVLAEYPELTKRNQP